MDSRDEGHRDESEELSLPDEPDVPDVPDEPDDLGLDLEMEFPEPPGSSSLDEPLEAGSSEPATGEDETFIDVPDEPPLPEQPEPPQRRRQERRSGERQTIVVRRLVAVGVGVLFVLLFGLALKACFNARNKSAMKDYVNRDVASIVSDSQQTSTQLFKTLNDPKGLTPLDYENEIKSDRGAADALVTRAEKVDAPGDMKRAQQALEMSLELRRDALTTISQQVPTALAREGSAKAKGTITLAMRGLLASDVVYARIAQPAMQAALAKKSINNVQVPSSQFLPATPDWLDPFTIDTALGKVSGSAASATPGTHGLGLLSTSIGGTNLVAGTPTQVSAAGIPELDVSVQNQGTAEESGVQVSVSISGGGATALDGTIPKIGPGETQDVKIPLTPKPPTGTQVTINVTVQAVPGEQVQTNNKATYTVTFQ